LCVNSFLYSTQSMGSSNRNSDAVKVAKPLTENVSEFRLPPFNKSQRIV
jgi:hypothetical protein